MSAPPGSADMGFLKIQQQIRENSLGVQDYIHDLYNFVDNQSGKDKDVRQKSSNYNPAIDASLPPIRNKAYQDKSRDKPKQAVYKPDGPVQFPNQSSSLHSSKPGASQPGADEQTLKRDTTPMPDYYKAWDKFAATKATPDQEELDEDGCRVISSKTQVNSVDAVTRNQDKAKSTEEFLAATSGARPNTKIVVKGAQTVQQRSLAEDYKNKGNSAFVSLEFEKAVEWYTKCIQQRPDNETLLMTAFSNRAQAFLKLSHKFQDALDDCNQALKIDPRHVKSLMRRGQALYGLKDFKKAKRDFHIVLALEKNTQALEMNRYCEDKLSSIRNAAYERMMRIQMFNESAAISGKQKQKLDDHKVRIQIREFNMDEEMKKKWDKQQVEDVEKENRNKLNRDRRFEQTEVKGNSVSKPSKIQSTSVVELAEDESEAAELKRLQEERKKKKKKRKSKKKTDNSEPSEPVDPSGLCESKSILKFSQSEEVDGIETKKSVSFGEDKIKEFDKNERISEPTTNPTLKAKVELPSKPKMTLQKLSDISKSSKVLETFKSQIQKPTNPTELERSLKSLQADPQGQYDFLRLIPADQATSDLQKIFKHSIETDALIMLMNVFDKNEIKEQVEQEHLRSIIEGLSQVDRFDMAVDFLMDDEKELIIRQINKAQFGSKDAILKKYNLI